MIAFQEHINVEKYLRWMNGGKYNDLADYLFISKAKSAAINSTIIESYVQELYSIAQQKVLENSDEEIALIKTIISLMVGEPKAKSQSYKAGSQRLMYLKSNSKFDKVSVDNPIQLY